MRALLPILCLALSVALSGCGGGNPTCIFAGACGSSGAGPGAVSGNPAVLPEDGQIIVDVPPSVSSVFPTGNSVAPSSPIVLVFSESMNEATVEGAFELVPVGGNIVSNPVANVAQQLLAEGRVLVLLPPSDLQPGAYIVRVGAPVASVGGGIFGGGGGTAPEAITDLTGQELTQASGQQVGSTFTVTSSPPSMPRVVMSYPLDGATGASDTPQLVVVFDRDLDPASVDDDSFEVTVEGADPVPDPVAEFLRVSGADEPRVLTWRSEDAGGTPMALGSDALVELSLSPSGNRLLDADGEELAATMRSFTTVPFATPVGAGLLSEPTDAIGLRNLRLDGDEDLSIQVDLLDAEPGDFLDVYCVGTNTDENDPILIALRREVRLTGSAPIQVSNLGIDDLDLTVTSDPSTARFADGSLSFAFRVRRGAFVSPLRLLDVDLATPGLQDAFLDTTVPSVTRLGIPSGGLGSGTGNTDLVSDLGDLVLTGIADETLESVEVTAEEGARSLGNGVLPSVVGSRADGGFVAAPVGLGVFGTGTATFTAVAYDRAFNPSAPITGTFTQRGAVGPTVFVPGDVLEIDVFDAFSLEPLRDAVVLVHADMGDGVNYPLTSAALTSSLGRVSLSSDGSAVGAIVTVDLAGYDLFTFHRVSGTRLSIPLRRSSAGATAQVRGQLTSEDGGVMTFLGGMDRLMDDTRLPFDAPRTYATGNCSSAFLFLCPYGPVSILPERLGVQSFLAGDFLTSETSFNVNQVLQAFCLEIPTGPAVSGALEDTSFQLPFLLSDPSVDASERPEELTPFTYWANATSGIDTGDLVDANPDTTGLPQVSVETLVPGTHGTVAVGIGLAFDQTGSIWNIRSARAGAVSPMGFFGERGAVDPDLFVRVEARDNDGNLSAVRPRLSSLVALLDLTSPDVPQLTTPAMGASTGGRAYNLSFADTLPDGAGQLGLYRVQLTGTSGRGWTVVGIDSTGAGPVLLRVPDPRDAIGGSGLADGSITGRLEALAWPDFDAGEFLWSDLEREFEVLARSQPFAYVQTP